MYAGSNSPLWRVCGDDSRIPVRRELKMLEGRIAGVELELELEIVVEMVFKKFRE